MDNKVRFVGDRVAFVAAETEAIAEQALQLIEVEYEELPALLDRFGSFTVHKWKEFGFRLVGFWTPMLGEKSNQVVYMWAWESYEERVKKNAVWRADPERAKKWAETEKDGPLVRRVYNQLMEPTSYSQLDKGEAYGPDAATRAPYFFELREYQAMPQKIQNITDRFGNFTCGAFKRHGFRQVGYWLNRIVGNDHQLTYMPVTWPDGSLGCPKAGMIYTQSLVAGYRIVLQAGDLVLNYHSAARGKPVFCPAGRVAPPVPADAAA